MNIDHEITVKCGRLDGKRGAYSYYKTKHRVNKIALFTGGGKWRLGSVILPLSVLRVATIRSSELRQLDVVSGFGAV
jgi:hypothetical protein